MIQIESMRIVIRPQKKKYETKKYLEMPLFEITRIC